MSTEPLQTRCPSCSTLFSVSSEDLARAGGRVRCGDCLHVFNGRDHAVVAKTAAPQPDHAASANTISDKHSDAVGPSLEHADAGPEQTSAQQDFQDSAADDPVAELEDVAAPTVAPDDSGAFRFSDDTPPEALEAELEALTSSDSHASALAAAAPQPEPHDTVAGSRDDAFDADIELADGDWDDLLTEIDDDAPQHIAGSEPEVALELEIEDPPHSSSEPAQSQANDALDFEFASDAFPNGDPDSNAAEGPLDFEIVNDDMPQQADSLDFDLSRADTAILSSPAPEERAQLFANATSPAKTAAPAEASTSADIIDFDSAEPNAPEAASTAAEDSGFDATSLNSMFEATALFANSDNQSLPEPDADVDIDTADDVDAVSDVLAENAALAAAPPDAPIVDEHIVPVSREDRAKPESPQDSPLPADFPSPDDSAIGETIVLSGERVLSGEVPDFDDDEERFAESMILADDIMPKPARGPWLLLTLLALFGLAGQSIHAFRDTLATQEPWAEPLARAYDALGAPITPRWPLDQICIERHGASAEESRLEIETGIANRGTLSQPLPMLKVRITDPYRDTLASRVLTPAEYLGDASASDEWLQPGQSVTAFATLDVAEPGMDNYQFSLCYASDEGALRCAGSCAAQ